MSEHPILFSGEMVRAILSGTKTQTRRIVGWKNSATTVGPKKFWEHLDFNAAWVDGPSPLYPLTNYLKAPMHDIPCELCAEYGRKETVHRVVPRIRPGDLLWVRETWVWAVEFKELKT